MKFGTPADPVTPNELPTLQDLDWITWDDVLTYAHTAKYIPKQCRALVTQLIAQICDHILTTTLLNRTNDAERAWKLLLLTPRLVFHNNHRRKRAGRKGQGNASYTKTIRTRIQQIYDAEWDALIDTTDADDEAGKSTTPPTENRDRTKPCKKPKGTSKQ